MRQNSEIEKVKSTHLKGSEDKKLKKILKNKWFIIAIIFISIVCLASTYIGSMYNQTKYSYVINNYQEKVSSLSKAEIEDKEQKAKKYNNSLNDLSSTGKYDKDTVTGYYDVLNLGKIISYIDIPKIDVYLPIYNNTDDKTLQNGIGHEKSSSLPVGGTNTNCVLLGHSGLTTNPLFTDLHKLDTGEYIYLKTMNKTYTYKVYDIDKVTPEEAENYTGIVKGKDIVTLITCTPIGINTHRLIVRGERVDNTQSNKAQIKKVNQAEDSNSNSIDKVRRKLIIIGLIVMIVAILFTFSYCMRKGEKKGDKKSKRK